MLRGKVEGEMALLFEDSSVKESSEDKQASAPCARGSAKISRRVTLALYTGCLGTEVIKMLVVCVFNLSEKWFLTRNID